MNYPEFRELLVRLGFIAVLPSARSGNRGFALVVTLSLMILLTIVAVGLLTLSSITLRKSSVSASHEQAQANAKLALMLAIGRVQSLAGPDTRITAPRVPKNPTASLNSVPPAYGVWRSWEGTDHETSGPSVGRPKPPDYNSKNSGTGAGGRFLGWLVSSADGAAPDPAVVPDLESDAASGLVPLVSTGSVTDPKRRVFLKPTLVSEANSAKGALGWWVGGENSKATLAPDTKPTASDTVAWQERSRAHAVPSPNAFGLAGPPDIALPSSGSLILAATDAGKAKGNFHDATVWASGLLTNAATGGWKRDLSLMTEKYDELPATGLPFFTLEPGQQQTFSKAAPAQTSPSTHPPKPLLYPWAQYSANPGADTDFQIPPIVSWDYLRNASVQYRSLTSLNPSSGRAGIPWALESFWRNSGKQFRYEFLDQPRRWPALSRIYFMFSFASVPDAANPDNLKAALVMSPVVVLWNPYNVEITLESPRRFVINFPSEVTPLKFRFTVNDVVGPSLSFNQITSPLTGPATNNSDIRLIGGLNGESITLKPGETRVFSVKDNSLVAPTLTSFRYTDLYPGYRTYGGLIYTRIGPDKTEVPAPKDSVIKVDLTFDARTSMSNGRDGYGSTLDFGYANPNFPVDGDPNGFSRRTSRQYLIFSEQVAKAMWPPITAENLPSAKLSDVLGNQRNRLFITGVVGFRTANDSTLPGKGYLQSNPLNYLNDLSNANSLGVSGELGAGIRHPANSSYDIQFINGADVSARPNAEPLTNRGYIVSGLDASSGLTQCVVAEIPTRPIQSICDLQHFDLRNSNPVPPFQFNILGNSQAHPLLPRDHVIRPEAVNPSSKRMQHDDAYCLNHLFFDDWFVSSIAPDLRDWTSQTERALDVVYKDFLSHSIDPKTGSPLPNRMYRPTPEAMDTVVEKAYDRDVKPADSYRHIASKLSVDGMFNVNSTSVAAWRALLGHNLGQRQPYLTESAGGWNVTLAPERDHVVSRMSVAGGGAAGLDAAPAGNFADALEFSGHRALTDPQLDALAEEIVRQVRLRGPFLSLSEFINRRLSAASSEEELALAGAVEAALSALAKRGTSDPKNPYRELQRNSREITQTTVTSIPALTEAKYLFPRAAEGWTANAMPGWLRQADILRPLAPSLSVRDDTFVIRAYGDARDAQGNITATAWCEAVIQRNSEFVDPSDPATDTPVLGTDTATEKFLQSAANERFGRRFTIASFRWLHASEI
jgi:hypothetical protein